MSTRWLAGLLLLVSGAALGMEEEWVRGKLTRVHTDRTEGVKYTCALPTGNTLSLAIHFGSSTMDVEIPSEGLKVQGVATKTTASQPSSAVYYSLPPVYYPTHHHITFGAEREGKPWLRLVVGAHQFLCE